MKILKPHFWYNKSQRNGVFFLLLIIVVLQFLYSFVDFSVNDNSSLSDNEVYLLQNKIDSLKSIEVEKRKPKIYPFNPNYLTDYKASKFGMSIPEINRLLAFRKQNKFVNSSIQFQEITKISDSLLSAISQYFKFPDWVVKQNLKLNNKSSKKPEVIASIVISTTDINKATIQDFETIKGVSENLAQRIVKYRDKLKGFTFEKQLYEVWKLDKTSVEYILKIFKVFERPVIAKININLASFKEVLSTPYVDYDLCKKIFAFRDEVAELQTIDELKKIDGFPLDKYDRIVLYLEVK
jgi:DNA uptake protein ComE-like DNA-binding protein